MERLQISFASSLMLAGMLVSLIGPTPVARIEGPNSPLATPTPDLTLTPTSGQSPTPTPKAAFEPSPIPFSTAMTEGVYHRVMQIWPDRSVGVASGRLESISTSLALFPFGTYVTPTGEVVRARVYLHFPLDLFPPGSEVVRATLHVYVDSAAGEGAATVGVYRVLEPWNEGAWGNDPRGWPTLLMSPIALTTASVSAMAGRNPLRAAVPVAASDSSAEPETASFVVSTATPSISPPATPVSPLPTPVSPLPTPTPSMPTPTARPTASPSPTLPPTPEAAIPVVALRQVTGMWLTWDVTALARAWLAKEVANYGLALAAAPNPDSGPEAAGNLLLARAFTADDPLTRPYLIAQIAVHPVTPTPVVLLPCAGSSPTAQSGSAILLAAGAILLIVGLILWGRWERTSPHSP